MKGSVSVCICLYEIGFRTKKKHNCWRYFVQSINIQVSEIEIIVMKESIQFNTLQIPLLIKKISVLYISLSLP